jgi:hypothetical protein
MNRYGGGMLPDEPNGFAFQVDPQKAPSTDARSPSRKNCGARLSHAAVAAGLKFKTEATHVFRHSGVTLDDRRGNRLPIRQGADRPR